MSADITVAVATGNTSPALSGTLATRAARIAAVLFVVATASTMAGRTILESVQGGADAAGARHPSLVSLAVTLEILNGLASAGIALALYPVLRHVSELAATGYLGLRIVEGTLGVAAAAGMMVLAESGPGWAAAYHEAMFLLVLIVFSCGTFLFYPLLFRYRLVPPVLSLWGLVGGGLLLVSCLLILFGRTGMGSTADLILSLPIWINEMVLAAWLFLRGFDPGIFRSGTSDAA